MPQEPTERRVVVTGPPRRTRRASGYSRPRTEIDEQTTLGHTYVRSLMRTQLRAALTIKTRHAIDKHLIVAIARGQDRKSTRLNSSHVD